jgi:hypothetical protein
LPNPLQTRELLSVSPLAITEKIMLVLLRLLFWHGSAFYDARAENIVDGVNVSALWMAVGVGHESVADEAAAESAPPKNVANQYWTKLDANRTEILIALIACCSQGLLRRPGVFLPCALPLPVSSTPCSHLFSFFPMLGGLTLIVPDEYRNHEQPWLAVLVDPPIASHDAWSRTLLVSLLNLIVGYEPVWYVPYAHQIMPDARADLVDAALHLLLVALDYRPETAVVAIVDGDAAAPPRSDHAQDETDSTLPPVEAQPQPQPQPHQASVALGRNLWVEWVGALSLPAQMGALFDGLMRLLNSVPDSCNTYLPYSRHGVLCSQELVLLVSKLVDLNDAFANYIASRPDCAKLVCPLLYFLHQVCTSQTLSLCLRRIQLLNRFWMFCRYFSLHFSTEKSRANPVSSTRAPSCCCGSAHTAISAAR